MGRACNAASPRDEQEEALDQPLAWGDQDSEADRIAD
jgi:hypothetical protein